MCAVSISAPLYVHQCDYSVLSQKASLMCWHSHYSNKAVTLAACLSEVTAAYDNQEVNIGAEGRCHALNRMNSLILEISFSQPGSQGI